MLVDTPVQVVPVEPESVVTLELEVEAVAPASLENLELVAASVLMVAALTAVVAAVAPTVRFSSFGALGFHSHQIQFN